MPIFNIPVWGIAKVLVLIALGLYIVISGVIIRQVQLMIDTLEVGLEMQVKAVAIIHFVLALIVFLIALIIL